VAESAATFGHPRRHREVPPSLRARGPSRDPRGRRSACDPEEASGMTEPIDLDVRLSRFLTEEAPRAVPDRLVAATREAVANTRQRRRGFGSQVSQFLLTPIGSVAAIVAVVVLGSILTLSNPFG